MYKNIQCFCCVAAIFIHLHNILIADESVNGANELTVSSNSIVIEIRKENSWQDVVNVLQSPSISNRNVILTNGARAVNLSITRWQRLYHLDQNKPEMLLVKFDAAGNIILDQKIMELINTSEGDTKYIIQCEIPQKANLHKVFTGIHKLTTSKRVVDLAFVREKTQD